MRSPCGRPCGRLGFPRALVPRDTDGVPQALALYRERRLPPMSKILDAASASIRWYERMDELIRLSPVDFAYSYMTRTGRVDHEEVARRDPKLAAAWERGHPEIFGASY